MTDFNFGFSGGGTVSELPKTGITTSVLTDDDGDLELGYTRDSTDNADNTVTDNKLNLMWIKDTKALFGEALAHEGNIGYSTLYHVGDHVLLSTYWYSYNLFGAAYKGTWDSNTSYSVGDVVDRYDGSYTSYYINTKVSNQNNEPNLSGTQGWCSVCEAGGGSWICHTQATSPSIPTYWQQYTSYSVNDIVNYMDNYICTEAHTSTDSFDYTKFTFTVEPFQTYLNDNFTFDPYLWRNTDSLNTFNAVRAFDIKDYLNSNSYKGFTNWIIPNYMQLASQLDFKNSGWHNFTAWSSYHSGFNSSIVSNEVKTITPVGYDYSRNIHDANGYSAFYICREVN